MKIFSLSVWRELLCSLLFWTSRKVLPYSPPKPSEIFIDMLVARMIAAPEKTYYFYDKYGGNEIHWKDNLYEVKLEAFSHNSKQIKHCTIKDERGNRVSFNDELKNKFTKVFPIITGFKQAEEEHKKELKALDQINRMMGLPSELDKKEFALLEEDYQELQQRHNLESSERMKKALLGPVNINSKMWEHFEEESPV